MAQHLAAIANAVEGSGPNVQPIRQQAEAGKEPQHKSAGHLHR